MNRIKSFLYYLSKKFLSMKHPKLLIFSSIAFLVISAVTYSVIAAPYTVSSKIVSGSNMISDDALWCVEIFNPKKAYAAFESSEFGKTILSSGEWRKQLESSQAGGKLADYQESVYANGVMNSAQIIHRVARDYSIHPRLLLALLEYESGWVYGNPITKQATNYPLGFVLEGHLGLYRQLVYGAGLLGSGYYGWREGTTVALQFPDGEKLRMAANLNCGTVGLMSYFAQKENRDEYR